MKSVKPGRGPSMMGGVVAIAAAVFGVFWIIGASSITSDPLFGESFSPMDDLFPLFGVVFVVIAIAMAVYHFKNATGKHRYSEFDIVDGDEEPDPLNERFGEQRSEPGAQTGAFCPYCGAKVEEDYEYCNHCGKKLP